ncbi:MAG: UPF0280 family protein [Lentisphaerae bacterium]|nr:UPF0280 family protein [Lentisphaerota bacterium]
MARARPRSERDGGAGAAVPRPAFRLFRHKDAAFRICCDRYAAVTAEIVRQRGVLEAYIRGHPAFAEALAPLAVPEEAPEVARRMGQAAACAGVGPMAAVAGIMAELAARAGLAAGAREAVVENGGDIFLSVRAPVVIGLTTGTEALGDRLAFRVAPESTPLAVCSSSGRMGRSMSLGACDLATVTARDAALADAAATRAANLVHTSADLDAALEIVSAIPGIEGVLLVKDARIGVIGRLPELVPAHAPGR